MLSARFYAFWSFVTIFSLSLYSCKDNNSIGLDLQPDQLQVTTGYVDTVNLEIGTIWFDSIPTYNLSRTLIGRVESPEFGSVKATTYTEFVLPTEDTVDLFVDNNTSLAEVGADSVFYDSVSLIYNYNYTDGDVAEGTTQRFYVHELSSSIDTANGVTPYSFNSIPKGSLLSTLDFEAGNSVTLMQFKLDDNLGQTLYDKALAKELTSTEDIRQYIKGFVISTDDDGKGMYGLDLTSSSSRFFVHYHYVVDGDTTIRAFQMLTGNHFHQLEVDRTGSPLEGLAKNTLLSSQTTGNKSYVQAGAGLYTYVKVEDAIKNFSLANKRAINRVDFMIRPVEGSVTDEDIPISTLELLQGDGFLRINEDDNGFALVVSDDAGRSGLNYNVNGQGYFPFTLTNYIDDIANEREDNNGFFLAPESFSANNRPLFNTTTNRLILGDRQYTGLIPMQIRIFYTEFK